MVLFKHGLMLTDSLSSFVAIKLVTPDEIAGAVSGTDGVYVDWVCRAELKRRQELKRLEDILKDIRNSQRCGYWY